MAEMTLDLETGRERGSSSARRMRAGDKVPGVLYGRGVEPTPVAVDRKALRAALHTDAGMNALLTLKVDGGEQLAVVRDLQRDPVRNAVLHVDFLAVDAEHAIRVDVPVVLTGEPEKVNRADGGTVEHLLFQVSVHAKPGSIPNELTVDISDLDIGDTVRVGDLTLPAGVTIDVDPDEAVATAKIVQREAVTPEEAAEAGLAAAEAAAAGGVEGASDEAQEAAAAGEAGGPSDEGDGEG